MSQTQNGSGSGSGKRSTRTDTTALAIALCVLSAVFGAALVYNGVLAGVATAVTAIAAVATMILLAKPDKGPTITQLSLVFVGALAACGAAALIANTFFKDDPARSVSIAWHSVSGNEPTTAAPAQAQIRVDKGGTVAAELQAPGHLSRLSLTVRLIDPTPAAGVCRSLVTLSVDPDKPSQPLDDGNAVTLNVPSGGSFELTAKLREGDQCPMLLQVTDATFHN
ncbi:hypothetical protein [Catenulispora subtropica]|uniref:Uncharacterized protein n=1 Tax=Catenulispora subtropica TaxID=450798 RepID=A0ABN2SC30_9ACTN